MEPGGRSDVAAVQETLEVVPRLIGERDPEAEIFGGDLMELAPRVVKPEEVDYVRVDVSASDSPTEFPSRIHLIEDVVTVGYQVRRLLFEFLFFFTDVCDRLRGLLDSLDFLLGREVSAEKVLAHVLDLLAKNRLEAAEGPLEDPQPCIQAIVDTRVDGVVVVEVPDLDDG